MHDAFRAALEQWPRDGVPSNPRTWLVSAGRFKAIDAIRRHSRLTPLEEVVDVVESIAAQAWRTDDDGNRGRPSASHFSPVAIRHCRLDAQVALTLREVCGLTTEEIASAYLDACTDAGTTHRAG
ncbi:hypothetical protein [Propionivibrio sp.]|uniref:hypothetical protein n=1 Tax=Propionivibrio sp. TaxID=2212460 RepID=UPI0025F13EB3|nr:hypothetical protein [Propionivibrio sp.]